MGGWFSKPTRANVFADHPFDIIATPVSKLPPGTEATMLQRTASEMALVHNMVFRALNAIVLQAPHITPADALSFAHYMHQWYRLIHAHHEGEESFVFPAIERLCGEEGIMAVNVEQHRTFEEGIADFGKYALECIADPKRYDGQKVLRIVDSFGDALRIHMNDEIPTLLALERFGDEKMAPLEDAFAEEGKQVMGGLGLTTGLPLCALAHDRHFENDIWLNGFPPGSGLYIMAITRRVTSWAHTDWWKFSPCDRSGTMQRLYAAKDEDDQSIAK